MKKIVFSIIIIFSAIALYGNGPKITVIPFTNANGNQEFDKYSFEMQDSLQKLMQTHGDSMKYEVIPYEEITKLLTERQITEENVQYETYMWQYAEELGVNYIITGNFLNQADKFIINTYIYDVAMKIPITSHQAKDIFVPQDKILMSVKPIYNRLVKYFNMAN